MKLLCGVGIAAYALHGILLQLSFSLPSSLSIYFFLLLSFACTLHLVANFSFFLRYFPRCLCGLNCSPALHLPPFASPSNSAPHSMLLGNELQLQRIELWGYANQPSANSSRCSCCSKNRIASQHRSASTSSVVGRRSHQHHLHSGRIQPSPICSAHNQHHQQTKNAFWPLIRCPSVSVSVHVSVSV